MTTPSDILKMVTGADRMIRDLLVELQTLVEENACVYLSGSSEVGKSDLVFELAMKLQDDAELFYGSQEAERARLFGDPSWLSGDSGKLVIIDDIQDAPEAVSRIRTTLQDGRRGSRPTRQFLLLGSASVPTSRFINEKLGTLVKAAHLPPILASELANATVPEVDTPRVLSDIRMSETVNINAKSAPIDIDPLWLRGGYPLSFFAKDEVKSLAWRKQYLESICERDYAFLGPSFSAVQAREHLQRLAVTQGELFVFNKGRIDEKAFIDALETLGMVRTLRPWFSNELKRLEKNPKIFLRDSGLLHCLLGRRTISEIEEDATICGHSWEGFCIENIVTAAPSAEAFFFRDGDQDEIDLVLEFPGRRRVAIEIKRSPDNIGSGFVSAIDKIKAEEAFVVSPVETGYNRKTHRVVSLLEMISTIRSR